MTTLATETWTGTNGAAWGSQWTAAYYGGTGTETIQSNSGRLVTPAAAYATSRAYLSGMTANTDEELVFSFIAAAQAEGYISISVDSDGVYWSNGGDPSYSNNGYFLIVDVKATSAASLEFWRMKAGVQTSLHANVSKTIVAGTQYSVRLRRVGTTVQARVWQTSGGEPGTWDFSVTETAGNQPPAGKVGLNFQSGSASTAGTVTFNNLTVTDGVTSVAYTGTADFSGTGTLLGAGTPKVSNAVTLSGTGALSASGAALLNSSGSATLSGTGTLTATGIALLYSSGTANLSGAGTLTASGVAALHASATANLSGAGTLSATGTSLTSGSSTPALSGSGTLSTTATLTTSGIAAFSGGGILATAQSITTSGSAALSGSGALTTTGKPAPSTSAALSGTGTLATAATLKASTTAAFTGGGNLVVSASATYAGAATVPFTGSGTLSTVAYPAINDPGSLGPASETTGLNWSGGGSTIVARQVLDPFGTNSATRVTFPATQNYIQPTLGQVGLLVTGKTYTFAGWARSIDGNPYTVRATVENAGGGSVGAGYNAVTITGTWQRFERTVTVGTSPGAVKFLWYEFNGDSGQGHTFDFTYEGVYETYGQTPTVALASVGTLAVSGTPTSFGTVTLTGGGTLGVAGKPNVNRSVTLTGGGLLSLSGVKNVSATVPFTGSGSLSTAATPEITKSVALTGNGSLTTAILKNVSGTAALSGSGTLAATGVYTVPTLATGSAFFAGSGLLSATGTTTLDPNGLPAPPIKKTGPLTTLAGTAIRQITGYSVVEDATPLDIADTTAGVGSISFAMPQTEDSVHLFSALIELDDSANTGTTAGVVTDVAIQDGVVSITADNRLGSMVATVTANPHTGTFESVVRYYLTLGGITDGVYFDPRIAGIPVTVQGWFNDVWLMLKQLCTANRVEIALVSNKIEFRPVRSFVTNTTKRSSFTTDIIKTPAASTVEIGYYNNIWIDGEVVYPRTVTEMAAATIYTVAANATVEADIALTASVASVLQPLCVDDVANTYDGTQSVYSVRAVDNSPVPANDWVALGGNIVLTINPDTVSLHIKITGCSDEYRGPYRICGRMIDTSINPTTVIIGPGQAGSTTAVADYGVGTVSTTKAKTTTSTTTTTTTYRAAVNDYPFRDGTIDRISVLGYGTRSCTDFVMWRMNRDANCLHSPWKYTWSTVRKTNGNAIGWKHDWELHGWKTGITPVPGCIAWFGTSAGALGHVAYVQAVGPGYVVLEDYNWGGTHGYHKHQMNNSQVDSFLQNPANPTPKVTTTHTSTAPKPKLPASISGYSGSQLTNASEIMRAARDVNFGSLLTQAEYIGVMTAMGESSLRALDYGDAAGPSSRGLFQQQTSWGSLADRMDPYKSAVLFYNALKRVSGWQNMTPTHAAHAVQINADPEYYTKFYSPAKSVVAAINKTDVGTTSKASSSTTSTKAASNSPSAVIAEQTVDQFSEIDYNSLRIVGTGTLFEPMILTLPTGASGPTGVGPTVGVTASNVHVSTLEEAYTAGVYVGQHYIGETQTISGNLATIKRADDSSGTLVYPTIADFDLEYKGFTIAQFNAKWAGQKISALNVDQKAKTIDTITDQVFGNVAGARILHGSSYYRVTTATISDTGVSFSATRDTIIGDFNTANSGNTIADFNAAFRGMSIAQFNRVALQGA